MTVLTAIDVVGVQAFVFRSQRLRDVVAASAVVEELISRRGLEPYLAEGGSVAVAAGGNALVTHPSRPKALEFVMTLTMRLLVEHPELGVVVAHFGEPPSMDELGATLALQKLARPPSEAQVGYGFTATCVESGQPAAELATVGSGPRRPTAVGLLGRRGRDLPRPSQEAVDLARKPPPGTYVLGDEVDLTRRADLEVDFPLQVDEVSIGALRSEVAVVHIDGSGIGATIQDRLDEETDGGPLDDEALVYLQAFSEELTAGFAGLADEAVSAAAPLAREVDGRLLLPVRPVLQGGDDLTFVCRASLALPLVRHLLDHLKSTEIEDLELRGIPAAAGVTIGPAGAPLWALIDMAAELTTKAKRAAEGGGSGWAYDWHVGLAGDDIEALRQRHLAADGQHLTARPYVLGSAEDTTLVELLSSDGNSPTGGLRNQWWRSHRSARRRVGEIAARGHDEMSMLAAGQAFERATGLGISAREGTPWEGFGWMTDGRSVLRDALELIDRWEDLR